MIKFSIIIPAYNVAKFLPACLQSVLDQDYSNYEVILVNDGSTDNTASIGRHYSDRNPKIRYYGCRHSGPASRNFAIQKAKGDYLLFLDSDDTFMPGALKTIANHLSDRPDLLRFQAQEIFDDGRIVPHPELGFSICSSREAIPKIVHYHYIENVWVYCYHTPFFKRHHFQYAANRLSEDFGLTPLVLAKARTIKSIPDICYNYHQRAGSIMHDPGKTTRRVTDAFVQLETLVPDLDRLEGSEPLLSHLIVSILTAAARLPKKEFRAFYRRAKIAGYLKHVKPTSLKSYPRALLIRYLPGVFRFCVKRNVL